MEFKLKLLSMLVTVEIGVYVYSHEDPSRESVNSWPVGRWG